MIPKLRDYQVKTIEKVLSLYENGTKSCLIVYATGLGKTVVASRIADQVGRRVLWLTHSEELIEQSALTLLNTQTSGIYADKIKNSGGIIQYLNSEKDDKDYNDIIGKVGIIKQNRMDIQSRINVASVQTIHRRLNAIPKDYYDLIIIDEAHLCMAKSWVSVIRHFSDCKLRIGLTATPVRLDGLSLGEMFECIAVNHDIKYGIDNGYLVEIDAIRIRTELSIDEVRTTAGELNQADLQRVINTPARNQLIVDSYRKYLDGKQCLVFCVDVKHAQDLTQCFRNNGLIAELVVSDEQICPNREEIISLFRSGEIRILVNVMIATTGFDHDMVEGIIMARPTKSLVLYCQSIGRGTRPAKGVIDAEGVETAEDRIEAIKNSVKPKLTVLDIVDNTSKHNLINTFTLDKGKPISERVYITRETRNALQAEEEERRRNARIYHVLKHDRPVNLFRLPKVRRYNSGRNLEPATPAQLRWIESLGYDVKNNFYTKYQAACILDELPASRRQLKELAEMGYDVSSGATRAEYKEAVKENRYRLMIRSATERLPFYDIE